MCVCVLRNGHGGLYKSPIKEERRMRKAKRRDQIKFIELRFERWQVVGLSELFEERLWWPIQNPEKGRRKKAYS